MSPVFGHREIKLITGVKSNPQWIKTVTYFSVIIDQSSYQSENVPFPSWLPTADVAENELQ